MSVKRFVKTRSSARQLMRTSVKTSGDKSARISGRTSVMGREGRGGVADEVHEDHSF